MPYLEYPDPSYAEGFVESELEAESPGLWRGVVGGWPTSLGNTGSKLRDVLGRNHGTLTNMVAADDWVLDERGLALDYDGTNDFVDIADISEIDSATKLSISFSFNQDIAADNEAMVAKWDYQTEGCFVIQTHTSEEIRIFIADSDNDAGGNNVETDAMNYVAGTWIHVVMLYDGAGAANSDRVKIFVDGAEETTTSAGTIPSSLNNAASTLKFGKFGGTIDRYFNGRIGDVIIWNRVLTRPEIRQLYHDPYAMWRKRPLFIPGVTAAAAGGTTNPFSLGAVNLLRGKL